MLSATLESAIAREFEKEKPLHFFSGGVVFCCQTPLHFLLTICLSRLWDGQKSAIWVTESTVDVRLIEQCQRIAGFQLICLPGGATINNKIVRTLTRSVNLLRLRLRNRQFANRSLVIFNDLAPETQYLITSFRARGEEVFLGEDGVATYATGGLIPTGLLSRILGKLLYGTWWPPSQKMGLNNKVSAIFASYPKLIRDEVKKGKTVLQLPHIQNDDLDDRFDINLKDHLVCIFPLTSSITGNALTRFVSFLAKTPKNLAIKLHPREGNTGRRHIETLLAQTRYRIIPGETPIEAICFKSRKLKEVVGYRSSALHLLKFLRPDLDVKYIELTIDDKTAQWRSFFEQTGVRDFFDDAVLYPQNEDAHTKPD
ncbi:MAG: hypothetical protein PWP40_2468 [Rhodocyclaceae bacterium]|nr:hypothetical protein [Rhodocyclaceae bacterium]